jgi:hypothetical protein
VSHAACRAYSQSPLLTELTSALASPLNAVDTGATRSSGVEIQVIGDYKPGRVITTVTDLTVPAPGMPIQIGRTYDSLNRATSSDFGNGWSLGINVQLDVSPQHDVTLTLNGQRRTFYFTPNMPGDWVLGQFVPNMLGVYAAAFTPEPGMHGTLVLGNNGSNMLGTTGCLFDWLYPYGDSYACYEGVGTYNPASTSTPTHTAASTPSVATAACGPFRTWAAIR